MMLKYHQEYNLNFNIYKEANLREANPIMKYTDITSTIKEKTPPPYLNYTLHIFLMNSANNLANKFKFRIYFKSEEGSLIKGIQSFHIIQVPSQFCQKDTCWVNKYYFLHS